MNDKRIETMLKFLSVLGLLIFLYSIFSTISSLPFYNLSGLSGQSPAMFQNMLQLIKAFNDSMLKMFVSVVAFSAIVIIILFGSNFRMQFNKNEMQIDIGIQENDFTPGMNGLKKVVDDQGNIHLHNYEVYRQLTEDYIISEVKEDGRPAGFITMESYLRGLKELCKTVDCQTHNITRQNIKKDTVYTVGEHVHIGESIFSVADKMVKNGVSALPVVDKNGVMKGSINHLQVLKILSDELAKQTKSR